LNLPLERLLTTLRIAVLKIDPRISSKMSAESESTTVEFLQLREELMGVASEVRLLNEDSDETETRLLSQKVDDLETRILAVANKIRNR